MKICLSQLNTSVGAIEQNFKLIIKEARNAQKNDAEIFITPELSLTGYPPEDLLLNKDFLLTSDLYLKKIVSK